MNNIHRFHRYSQMSFNRAATCNPTYWKHGFVTPHSKLLCLCWGAAAAGWSGTCAAGGVGMANGHCHCVANGLFVDYSWIIRYYCSILVVDCSKDLLVSLNSHQITKLPLMTSRDVACTRDALPAIHPRQSNCYCIILYHFSQPCCQAAVWELRLDEIVPKCHGRGFLHVVQFVGLRERPAKEMVASTTCKGTVSPACHALNNDNQRHSVGCHFTEIQPKFDQNSINWRIELLAHLYRLHIWSHADPKKWTLLWPT